MGGGRDVSEERVDLTLSLSLSIAFVFAKGAKDAPGGQVSTKVYNVVSYLRQSGY